MITPDPGLRAIFSVANGALFRNLFFKDPQELLVVAALASYLPARPAVAVNPVEALREE